MTDKRNWFRMKKIKKFIKEQLPSLLITFLLMFLFVQFVFTPSLIEKLEPTIIKLIETGAINVESRFGGAFVEIELGEYGVIEEKALLILNINTSIVDIPTLIHNNNHETCHIIFLRYFNEKQRQEYETIYNNSDFLVTPYGSLNVIENFGDACAHFILNKKLDKERTKFFGRNLK